MKERANAKECRFELVVIYIFKIMRDRQETPSAIYGSPLPTRLVPCKDFSIVRLTSLD